MFSYDPMQQEQGSLLHGVQQLLFLMRMSIRFVRFRGLGVSGSGLGLGLGF